MDFLSLCKKARQEARISGDGPVTVNSQIGILNDVVNAVQDAWHDLQMQQPTWSFMEASEHVALTPDQLKYSVGDLGIQRLGKVVSIHIGFRELEALSWSEYQTTSHLSELVGEPVYYCFGPDRNLRFLPALTDPTEVFIRYRKTPSELILNTDEPDIPIEHRPVIYWAAVMKLTANESDSVIYQKAMEHYDAYLLGLQDEFLPAMEFRGRRFV